MDPGFPDLETLRAVLTLATHAPSVHNSQPWHWVVGTERLHLYADPVRHLPQTDPDRRDLLLGCGAALHHCTVALAAMGWRAVVERMPDPADRNLLATIEVIRRPPEDLDVMLAAAITRRRTDRRTYNPWPVPWGDIALMGSRAARAGVMLRQIGPAAAGLGGWAHGPDRGVAIALGTETDDEVARLRAGEATSLVLLSATAMGLASCPASETLAATGNGDAVRSEVFGGAAYPQMLLRVGWAALDAEPLPAEPRRPLSEVSEWSGAAATMNLCR